MIRKISGVLFILLGLWCAVGAPAAAQSCTGHMDIQRINFLSGAGGTPSGCFWLAASSILFDYLVGCWHSDCPPPGWCPTCRKTGGTTAGNPINLTNGNTYIQQRDVRIPGLGGGLSLDRTWDSMWPATVSGIQTGMFGPNWRSTYEERVFPGSGIYSGYTLYVQADGSVWVFASNGTLTAPASVTATLSLTTALNGTLSWTLAFQNGEKRIFSYASGSLTSIVDPNGNTTQLSYDGINRLVTVTDPSLRHLTFTYGSSFSNFLVTGVSSDVGLSLSYSYDSQGRLNQVTKPDLT